MPPCANGPSAGTPMPDRLTSFAASLFQTRIVSGPGKAATLRDELDRLGVERVAVLCTPSGATRYRRIITDLGPRCTAVFAQAALHSPLDVAESAARVVRDSGAAATVCIGGGSTIGLGKFIAVTEGKPQVAIPTTLSGSELTPIYGFRSGSEKRTGVNPAAVPRLVIYDPRLSLSLPGHETALSGMNCLAHCVEAFYVADAGRLSDMLAGEGIRVLFDALPRCLERPDDETARGDAQYGGLLGGLLVAMIGIGLHHKICHLLGGRFGLPHGASNVIILPQVIAFNAPAMPDTIRRMAEAMSTDDPARACFDLARRLGAPTSLREMGVDPVALGAVAADIAATPPGNPRPLDKDSVEALLQRAWNGDEPNARAAVQVN